MKHTCGVAYESYRDDQQRQALVLCWIYLRVSDNVSRKVSPPGESDRSDGRNARNAVEAWNKTLSGVWRNRGRGEGDKTLLANGTMETSTLAFCCFLLVLLSFPLPLVRRNPPPLSPLTRELGVGRAVGKVLAGQQGFEAQL